MASRHYIYLHGAGSFFVIYKKRKELDMEEVHDLSEELYLDVLTEAYNRRYYDCLLYTSPSPRDRQKSRMPSSA